MAMNESNLDDALRLITRLLDRSSIAYAVMGGLAARAHGLPRATYDVDLTISIDRDRLPELYRQVEELGFTVPEQFSAGWVDEVSGMPLVKFRWYVNERGIDIDCFLCESRFQESLLERRRSESIDGWNCDVVTPEDLILLKLISRRPRDLSDIGDVLFIQGKLDEAYMREWARQLDVSELLEQLLSQS